MSDYCPAERLELRVLFSSAAFDPSAATLPAALAGAVSADLGMSASEPSGASAGYRITALAAAADGPRLQVAASTLYLTDAVGGSAGASADLTLTNAGTGDLLIRPDGFSFVGAGADQFRADLSSFGTLLPAGRSATIRVRMNATRTGLAAATLRITSNDATGTVTEVALRGIGSAAGSAGPTTQNVLDLYGIPMQIARPAGVGGTIAGEKAMQLLAKAGPGPVTIQPLAASASGSVAGELMKVGRYAAGATPATTPLVTVTTTAGSEVAPTDSAVTSFDPGGATFGLYVDWPGLTGRSSYSQDAQNAWETAAAAKRKVRFYSLKGADGAVVPDAYLVTAESGSSSASRLGVMVVRNVREATLPAGWLSHEVGTAAVAGSASVGAGGAWAVAGGGADVGGTTDAFHFAYRTLDGDGEVVARVTAVGATNAAAKAGVMIRESLAPNARQAMMAVTSTAGTQFLYRSATGGATAAAATASVKAPYWVRLVRSGNTLIGYRSADGKAWVEQGRATVPMASTVYVGLGVTAKDNTKVSASAFDNVSVTPAAGPGRGPVAPQVAAPATAAGTVTVAARASDAATSARLVVDGAYAGAAVAGPGPYAFAWDTHAVADGSHAVAVETTDRFGNVVRSAPASVTTANPDNPPDVRVAGLALGKRAAGTLSFSAVATDERGVTGVRYLVDGSPLSGTLTTAPYASTWDTTRVADGWHELTAVATDAGGNTTTSVAVRVRVANTAAAVGAEVQPIQVLARRQEGTKVVPWNGQVIPEGARAETAPRSKYGGDTAQQLAATGYFRTVKVDGRWWMVDPDGYLYFDNAVTTVAPSVQSNNSAAFAAKFGGTDDAAKQKWARWADGWLADVGVRTAAPFGDPALLKRAGSTMNYELLLNFMSDFAKTLGTAIQGTGHTVYANDAMPVFDPRFAAYCDRYFANVFPSQYPGLNPKADPRLVGYMTDNELPWTSATLDNYLTLPAGDANRAAAEAWLRGRGVDAPTDADRADFQSYVADTYFRVTSRAIRAYDPNHMVLGARFLSGDGQKAWLMQAARPYVDVASVNYYDNLNPGTALTPAAAAADLPFMVTESYAKGADSGLGNRSGFGLTVYTQADRGAFYQSNALSVLGSSYGVGMTWLQLMDNNPAATGADQSNLDANKGLMPITYPEPAANPYKPLTDRIRDLSANLYALIRQTGTTPAGPAVVTVAAVDADGSEAAGDLVAFTVTRAGGDPTVPLTVRFALDGTASLADDFGRTDATVVIPAGQTSTTLALQPLPDDEIEGTEVARFRVTAGTGYTVGTPDAAEAIVGDVVTPFTATLVPVAPDPRTDPVDAVTVQFNRAATGVDPDDFALSRDGIAVPLGGAVVVPVDAKTFQVAGLAPLTAAPGLYELRLAHDLATIVDAAGSALANDWAEAWQTVVPPPPPVSTTLSLRATADAYGLDGTSATKNFGTSGELQVRLSSVAGNWRESFLRFDLSQVASAAQITSAVVRLTGRLSAAGSVTVGLFPLTGGTGWTETGLIWNNKPTSSTTAIGATTALTNTSNATVDFDVTSYLKQQKAAGATVVNLALKATNYTTPYATFASDEATAGRPELRVTQSTVSPPPVPPAAPAIVLSTAAATAVPEGGTAAGPTLRLSAQPAATVTVTVARQSGDADLSAGPTTLVFTPTDWATPRPLTLAAAQDDDAANGSALFAVSAPGLATVTLAATEQDDDGVVPPPPPPPTSAGPEADLMSAATDQKIATLTDGYVIDMNQTGTRLNVQGLPVGPAGSLSFLIDGQVIKTESFAPYTIGGDAVVNGQTDFLDWTPPVGTHQLTVIQYAGAGGTGDVQGTTALTFTAIAATTVPPSPPTSPPASPPAGTPVSVRASADAYGQDGPSAGTNFGASGELQVRLSSVAGNWRETFLRFDLTQVPSAAQLTSAKLRLYGRLSQAGSVTVGLFPITGGTGWTESGLTWNNRPAGSATAIGSTQAVATTANAWYEFDVTGYLEQQKAAGATVVNLALKATNYATPYVTFASDEAAANRPELLVS